MKKTFKLKNIQVFKTLNQINNNTIVIYIK